MHTGCDTERDIFAAAYVPRLGRPHPERRRVQRERLPAAEVAAVNFPRNRLIHFALLATTLLRLFTSSFHLD